MNGELIYFLPFALLVFSRSFSEYFIFPKNMIFFFFSCITLLFYLKRKELKVFNPFIFFSMVFYFGMISFFSKIPDNSLIYSFHTIIIILFMTQKKRIRMMRYLTAINISGILICIYSLFQISGFDFFFTGGNFGEWQGINRVFSFLGNKNFVSEVLMLIIILNFSFKRFLRFNLVYIFLVILLFEKSAVLFLLLYIIWLMKSGKLVLRKTILILSAGFLLIISITLIYSGKYDLHNRLNGKNSADQRFFIWKTSADIISEYFLTGCGPGNFRDCFYYYQIHNLYDFDYNYFSEPVYAHNEILHIWSETGFIGVILLSCFFLPVIRKGLKNNRFRFIILYLIYQSLFSFPLRLPSVLIIILPLIRNITVSFPAVSFMHMREKNSAYYLLFILLLAVFLTGADFYYVNYLSTTGFINKEPSKLIFAERINFTSAVPPMNAGLHFYGKEDYVTASFYFERAWKYTRNPIIYYYRGMTELAFGNMKKASELLERFICFYPFTKEAYFNLHLIYKNMGEENLSEEYLRKFNEIERLRNEY